MRKTKNTDRSAESAHAIDPAALTAAIERQRGQLFQVQAIAGALGVAIQEGYDTLDLELVTRAIIKMLDDVIEALEPGILLRKIAQDLGTATDSAMRT